MDKCVFCKIVDGEVPSFKIYEDGLVRVFLDQNGSSTGHMIVIPKKHYEGVFDVPDDTIKEIAVVCKKMANLCKERLSCTGINILNASGKSAQESISHLHFHIVPRFEDDGLDLWFHGNPTEKESLQDTYRKLV